MIGQFLFAVNAASNTITSFAVDGTSLTRISTVASGGTLPISLTTHGNIVYVLNAGGTENITGFSVGSGGALTVLAGSTRPLSGTGVGPAQVGFDPSGRWLVVTEKNTNRIDVYAVAHNGYASAPIVNPSAGQTPFGFAFNQHGVLIVSEAFGGAVDASAVSSYTLGSGGSLDVVSASVPTTETAACWVAVTNNGKFAYAANTGSASVTGFEVRKASLTILDADGKTGDTGTTPIDVAVSRNSQFLYTLTAGSHTISAFAVRQNDGSLLGGRWRDGSARRHRGPGGAVVCRGSSTRSSLGAVHWLEFETVMRLSLNRALLGAVGAAILAGMVPAAIVLDRRLASALEDRARVDLALAPRVLADRLSANATTLMMYAKDLAHTAGLANAVAQGDRSAAIATLGAASAALAANPVLVGPSGDSWTGPVVDSALLAQTRAGTDAGRHSSDGTIDQQHRARPNHARRPVGWRSWRDRSTRRTRRRHAFRTDSRGSHSDRRQHWAGCEHARFRDDGSPDASRVPCGDRHACRASYRPPGIA